MAKHTTRKASTVGKVATVERKAARLNKYRATKLNIEALEAELVKKVAA